MLDAGRKLHPSRAAQPPPIGKSVFLLWYKPNYIIQHNLCVQGGGRTHGQSPADCWTRPFEGEGPFFRPRAALLVSPPDLMVVLPGSWVLPGARGSWLGCLLCLGTRLCLSTCVRVRPKRPNLANSSYRQRSARSRTCGCGSRAG